jgi:hypothetical protein
MKWFVMMLIFSSQSFARTPELLKCLGAEEKAYHLKKDLGPSYDLNQRLIAEIIQVPNATIEGDALKAICNSKGSESWKLLQLSLTKGKAIFVIPADIGGMQKQVTEGMIEDYVQATKEILLSLITQIQAEAPAADCLTTEFPRLRPFFRDLKYLQEDVDVEKLFKGRDEKIFKDLQSYKTALKNCQARLKKKAKSESSAPAKKS